MTSRSSPTHDRAARNFLGRPRPSAPKARARRRPPVPRVLLGGVLALALVAAACGADQAEIQGIQRPQPLDVSSVTLSEVSTNGSEVPFTFRAEPGHLLVAYFGYTHCPDICPTTLSDVSTALTDLGDRAANVDVAFVTVDPDRDTAAVVVPYLHSFIPDGHAIRTADPAVLASAKKPFGADWNVSTSPQGTTEVEHTAITYVVDPGGRVVDEWPFGTSSEVMASDLQTLLSQLPEDQAR